MSSDSKDDLNDLCTITVLFQDSASVDLSISNKQNISELKSFITKSESIHIPEGKSVRILCLNHFMNDELMIVEVENTLKEFTVHAILKSEKNDTEVSEENQLRGFDRLATMNYSQSEIQQIRRQFHEMANSYQLTHEQQKEEEEEWFPALFNQIDTPIAFFAQRREDEIPRVFNPRPRYPHSFNLLIGFFIGLFFGFTVIVI